MLRRPTWLGLAAIALAAAGQGAVSADDAGEEQARPWLGISYDGSGANAILGLPVTNVFEESGALACGVRVGDEIIEVDGVAVQPGSSLSALIERRAVGDRLTVRVFRGDKVVTVHPVLTARVGDNELLHRQLVGKRAQAFSLVRPEDPDGPPIEDSILVGKVGIVAWFDARCGECTAIVNELAPWVERHSRDVVGLGGTNGDPVQVAAILQQTPVLLPVGIDKDAWLHYGLMSDPSDKVAISVIDRAGVVRMAAAISSVDDSGLDDVFAAAERAIRQRKSRR